MICISYAFKIGKIDNFHLTLCVCGPCSNKITYLTDDVLNWVLVILWYELNSVYSADEYAI